MARSVLRDHTRSTRRVGKKAFKHRVLRTLSVVTLALLLATAAAQERFEHPQGRFVTPLPDGWSVTATPDVVTLQRSDPDGLLHVLAPVGSEMEVVAAALAILVDPALDAGFAAAPLQAGPVPLESGTWTQRLYQVGEDIVAAISLEREGYTVLVLAQASQPAFMQAVNAATNQVLLGLEVRIDEPVVSDPSELPYDVLDTRFTVDEHELVGTLTLPPGEGPHPGLVVVAGSGAQDRDGVNPGMPGYAPLAWLADHLTRAGFAVLRFDERGFGESTGDHLHATTADLADDVAAGLRHLGAFERVNAARVGLLGHSEGGVIVGRVAAARPDEVAFVIKMAGPMLPYGEITLSQVARIAEAGGASEEQLAETVEQQRQSIALARAGDWDGLEAFMADVTRAQIEALPEEQRAALPNVDALVEAQVTATIDAMRSPWMQFLLDYDPRDDWRLVRVPVLALFGALDVQIDLERNRPELEATLAEAGNDDVTVLVFEDANHLFQRAVTGNVDEYVALEMAFLPGFLDAISDWLEARFLP